MLIGELALVVEIKLGRLISLSLHVGCDSPRAAMLPDFLLVTVWLVREAILMDLNTSFLILLCCGNVPSLPAVRNGMTTALRAKNA